MHRVKVTSTPCLSGHATLWPGGGHDRQSSSNGLVRDRATALLAPRDRRCWLRSPQGSSSGTSSEAAVTRPGPAARDPGPITPWRGQAPRARARRAKMLARATSQASATTTHHAVAGTAHAASPTSAHHAVAGTAHAARATSAHRTAAGTAHAASVHKLPIRGAGSRSLAQFPRAGVGPACAAAAPEEAGKLIPAAGAASDAEVQHELNQVAKPNTRRASKPWRPFPAGTPSRAPGARSRYRPASPKSSSA